MATLLITATVFEDVTRLAYSLHSSDRAEPFGPIHQCEAGPQAWGYLLHTLPDAALPGVYDVRMSVIDRRPGSVATSRSRGISLT